MSRAQLAALAAMLTLGVAPRLAAQDSSTAGQARPDTSAYTGAGGVDTSARPGQVGAIDTLNAGAADTAGLTRSMGDTAAESDATHPGDRSTKKAHGHHRRLRAASDSSGAAGQDTTSGAAAGDTSGMRGRHPDSTKAGATTGPAPDARAGTDTTGAGTMSADTSEMAQPSTQPSQSTSPSR